MWVLLWINKNIFSLNFNDLVFQNIYSFTSLSLYSQNLHLFLYAFRLTLYSLSQSVLIKKQKDQLCFALFYCFIFHKLCIKFWLCTLLDSQQKVTYVNFGNLICKFNLSKQNASISYGDKH